MHIVMKIPVYKSDRVEKVYVEMQIRTIAMDFWASLEHIIYYKYNKQAPKYLTEQLKQATLTVSELDQKMESINNEINILKKSNGNDVDDLSFNPQAISTHVGNHLLN